MASTPEKQRFYVLSMSVSMIPRPDRLIIVLILPTTGNGVFLASGSKKGFLVKGLSGLYGKNYRAANHPVLVLFGDRAAVSTRCH